MHFGSSGPKGDVKNRVQMPRFSTSQEGPSEIKCIEKQV